MTTVDQPDLADVPAPVADPGPDIPAAGPPALSSGRSGRRRWWALAVLGVIQFMVTVDATIVNVALPSIQRDLGFSGPGLTWVVNGYVLMASGLLLLSGRVADLLGRRRIFLVGTALFALASLTAAVAVNPAMLVVSRFAQGAADALVIPATVSIVALLFDDPESRGKAFGIWGAIAGAASFSGVLLSGVLTDLVSWRWVFLINLPLALVPLLLVRRLVDESRAPVGLRRSHLFSALLVIAGLTAFSYGVLASATHRWTDAAVAGPVCGGLVALGVFGALQSRMAEPLVPLRFFQNRTRVAGNASIVFLACTSAAVFFLLVLYMQNVLDYTPLQSGLAWLPFCAAFMPGLMLSGRLSTRFGLPTALVVGFCTSGLGVVLLGWLPADGSYLVDLLPAMLATAFGFGIINPALNGAALHDVTEEDAGLGSGVAGTLGQLGGAVGLAAFVAIAVHAKRDSLLTGASSKVAEAWSYQLVFRIAAVVLLIGGLVTYLLTRRAARDAAAKTPAEAVH